MALLRWGECLTTPFSSREGSLPTPVPTQWKEDDCLPIILNSSQYRRVSLPPRSGRNERSEWRTARRAVDRRGSAAPFADGPPPPPKRDLAAAQPALQLSGLPG